MVSKNRGENTSAGIWTDYQHFVIKKGISRRHAVWYVRWIREFVRYRDFTILSEINEADISRFTEALSDG